VRGREREGPRGRAGEEEEERRRREGKPALSQFRISETRRFLPDPSHARAHVSGERSAPD
jgi:hypothetical protein